MCKNPVAYNNGRNFFFWLSNGILLTDSINVNNVTDIIDGGVFTTKSSIPFGPDDFSGNSIGFGETYTEKYTGNTITVSDDGDAVITLQATPSRDDENVSAYKLDFFIRDATKVIGMTSMMITNKLYAMEAVEQFKEDYQFLLS